MLKKVQEITRNKRFISEASVEERMACGIGACLGCVVRMKDGGYKRACVEGPVFNLEELELD
jgi:dihydroorotate dehydrogenase electron transfer subunit